jgi:hypothetical protein
MASADEKKGCLSSRTPQDWRKLRRVSYIMRFNIAPFRRSPLWSLLSVVRCYLPVTCGPAHIARYICSYCFLGAWMASLMAIYLSTTADTCAWSNGDNFCLGESKFHNLIDAGKSSVREQVAPLIPSI